MVLCLHVNLNESQCHYEQKYISFYTQSSHSWEKKSSALAKLHGQLGQILLLHDSINLQVIAGINKRTSIYPQSITSLAAVSPSQTQILCLHSKKRFLNIKSTLQWLQTYQLKTKIKKKKKRFQLLIKRTKRTFSQQNRTILFSKSVTWEKIYKDFPISETCKSGTR